MLKVLFIGDIVSSLGRLAIKELLPEIKEENQIDVVIANCENVTHGRGIIIDHYRELLNYGIDAFTAGEHIYRNTSIIDHLDELKIAIPYNFYSNLPGNRYIDIDTGKKGVLRIVSLLGTTFMNNPPAINPFHAITKFLETNEQPNILIDFHAEATSEKKAMGFFLAKKVPIVVGTHTHIQTNDAQILQNSTAYITDVGMTGSLNSVIGVKKEIILNRFNKGVNDRFEWEKEGPYGLNAVMISIDIENIIAKNIDILSLTSR